MKKIYLVLIVLLAFFTSCDKHFEDYNTDQKKPTEVPADFLFTNSLRAIGDQVSDANVNLNIWKLWAQYWTETTYTDECNYDITNRSIPDLAFRTYYRDILADLKNARDLYEAETAEGADAEVAKSNRLFICDLVDAYCYNRLLDMFGNIPYTEALDINNISPVYDDAYTVYQDLITKVKAAVAGLDATGESFGSADIWLGGDVAMWKKFGNTLLVKMGITLADYGPAASLSQSTVEGAYAGAFEAGEMCEMAYPGGQFSNQIYVNLVQSGRHDFVACNTIVNIMNDLEDPRRPAYFFINGDEYVGGPYGESAPFANYSQVADAIQEATFPVMLLDYTEMCFYLAEAAERGYSVGQSADMWYNYGIGSSFTYWGFTQDDIIAYLSKPEVNYATATGDWRQKIGTQAYLAFYLRGLIAWTEWRRMDWPVFNLPPVPETTDGQVPRRYTYPVNEQTLNATNYYQAGDAIGGDDMSTRIFWDPN